MRRLLARAQETGRSDDTEDVIRHRLALYYEVTHPILEWYGERGILVSVDANRDADAVGRQILTALEVLRQVVERDDGTPAQGGRPDRPRRGVRRPLRCGAASPRGMPVEQPFERTRGDDPWSTTTP